MWKCCGHKNWLICERDVCDVIYRRTASARAGPDWRMATDRPSTGLGMVHKNVRHFIRKYEIGFHVHPVRRGQFACHLISLSIHIHFIFMVLLGWINVYSYFWNWDLETCGCWFTVRASWREADEQESRRKDIAKSHFVSSYIGILEYKVIFKIFACLNQVTHHQMPCASAGRLSFDNL